MNNFSKIKAGDKIKVTWNERYYGLQEDGHAYMDGDTLKVKFDGSNDGVSVDQLRNNIHIERIEIVDDVYGADTPRDWQSTDHNQRFFKPK